MGFASDTAVRAEGDGRYVTEIRPGWDIAGRANGGYLLSIVGRALQDATGRPDPVTVTGHYLFPGQAGPASVATVVVNRGHTFTTATGSLHAGGKRLLQVLGTFGDVSTRVDPSGSRRRRPRSRCRTTAW